MRRPRPPLAALLVVVAVSAAVFLGSTFAAVDRATRPPRREGLPPDFDALMMRAEPMNFEAADGVLLTGLRLPGAPGAPAIVMGHDLGQDKHALLHLAVPLSREGYELLLFDFRGHGESGGKRSTLGVEEKRDVLAAVAAVARQGHGPRRRVGAYGVGMGAHAIVLAAADCPPLEVLVLDGVYPDPAFQLVREVYPDWGFGRRNLAFVPAGMFALLSHTRAGRHGAEGELGRLVGREMLLLAPENDAPLSVAMKRMYEGLPQQTDADGSLVFLPATQRDGLYGDSLGQYVERVRAFFLERLPRS